MTTETNPAALTTTPKGPTTLAQFLEQRRDSLAQVVPKHLSVDRLLKVALNSVAKTPALQKCSMASILQCVVTCAELGLEPGGALGGAYLVPYKETATLIVGYRGFVDLMRRSGQLSSIKATIVHAKDKFRRTEGLETTIEHEPFDDGDPGAMRLVYCVIRLKDGGTQVEVMSKSAIDAVRARSRSGGNGPWVTDYEEMAKKTVIRRAAKLAPMSSEVAKAIEAEDEDFVDGELVAQSAEVVTDAAEAALKKRARRFIDVPSTDAPEESAEKPTP